MTCKITLAAAVVKTRLRKLSMKKLGLIQKPLGRLLLAMTLVGTSVMPATAATIAGTGWKGTSSSLWSVAGNWDSTGPAADERNLFFGQGYKAAGGGGSTTANNDVSSYHCYRITFQDSNAAGNNTDGSSANDTAFTLTGNGFTLFDFGGGFPRIENDSFLTQTFTLSSGQILGFSGTSGGTKAEFNPVNGNIIVSAGTKVDLVGTTQLQIFGNNGKSITFKDIISSSGNNGTNSFLIGQNSTVIFAATNTYGGDTYINAGTLQCSTNNAVTSTTFIRIGNTSGTDGANLNLDGGLVLAAKMNVRNGSSGAKIIANTAATTGTATYSGNLFVDADFTLFANTGGGITLSGGTLDLKNQTMTVDGSGAATISGTLQNSTGNGNIVKKGAGTLALTGNNTYTGTTTVNGGSLRVNGQTGAGTVVVNPGGTLSGNGRIGGAVTVSNSVTAVLYPNSGATLTFSNNLTIGGSSAVVKFDLSSTTGGANDKIVLVNGTLSCGGAQLTLNLTNATLAAADYVLFDVGASGTISGSFNSTPLFTGTTPNYSTGYSIVTVGKTVVLRYTPLSVTITNVIAGGKVYDGTNTATLTNGAVSGLVSPDTTATVTSVPGTGAFASKNFGTWTVTASGFTLGGANASRYALAAQPTLANATITAKGVTITGLAANNKTYDGTNTATLSGTPSVVGVISPDGVTVNATSAAATFATANVGTQAVTVTGYALGGTDAGNYTLTAQPVVANATITPAGTTLGLTTSATPRSQPGDNVTFTATLTATPASATGSIQFLTNGVAAGSPVSLTGLTAQFTTGTLPPGTNSITAQYAGDADFTGSTNSLNQVVNHLPVAGNVNYYRGAVHSFKFKVSDLLTNVTDLDGDSNSISGFSTSTNGITLTTSGGFVMYSNVNLVNDRFTYTVNDGFGGSATGTITITAQAFLTGQSATVSIGGSTATVGFAGIPGYSYSAQRSTNLVDWTSIGTTNAPANGRFNVTDDFSDLGVVPGSAYYRLQYNP